MSEERKSIVAPERVGAIAQVMRTLQLVWRLLNDARVSLFPKLIVPAALVYVISPIDVLPDVILGLGQLDDLGVIALGIALFIEFCPRAIVEEHRRIIAAQAAPPPTESDEVIDGSYRVVDDK
ncbi:MAG: DUF1232 domain-containing protein [Chloroflexi bacterium]|nr:DUF1232 domain-containing protein [Chloroflexota bacterium]